MKKKSLIYPFLIALVLGFMMSSCKKKVIPPAAKLATLTTVAVSNIDTTTATGGGTISNTGNATITSSGLVWSTISGPTLNSGGMSVNSTPNNNFTSNLTGLAPSTTYYVRAYATNSAGTAYGNEVTFITKDEPPAVPGAAAAAGFKTLTFDDEFNSLSTIDVNATEAPGFNWYTDLPYGGHGSSAAYSISNGVLTITPTTNTGNGNIYSYSPSGNTGHTFQYAYFEARMRFNPNLGTSSSGWPAFWSISTKHLTTNNLDHWAELDFFEGYTGGYAAYDGAFVGTLHDWANSGNIHYQNSNNYQNTSGIDYSQWHTYGCLWTPGKVTWYFDGVAKMTQNYSATAPPSPLANGPVTPTPVGVFNILDQSPGGNSLILGSGPGWPIDVDWVHSWQQ